MHPYRARPAATSELSRVVNWQFRRRRGHVYHRRSHAEGGPGRGGIGDIDPATFPVMGCGVETAGDEPGARLGDGGTRSVGLRSPGRNRELRIATQASSIGGGVLADLRHIQIESSLIWGANE